MSSILSKKNKNLKKHQSRVVESKQPQEIVAEEVTDSHGIKRRQSKDLGPDKKRIKQNVVPTVSQIKQKAKEPILQAPAKGLQQKYIICPSEKRLQLLFTFLSRNRSKKVAVFLSSDISVQYHQEFFKFKDLDSLIIHEAQSEKKRTSILSQFSKATSGILLCTEAAVEGFEVPPVDWMVQYDPPYDVAKYLDRLGKFTQENKSCNVLLILRPEELEFLNCMKKAKVALNKLALDWNKVAYIQLELENLVTTDYFFYMSAREAYKAYMRAYDSHQLKNVFSIDTLDVTKVASSFGMKVAPAMDFEVAAEQIGQDEVNHKDVKKSSKKPVVYRQPKRKAAFNRRRFHR